MGAERSSLQVPGQPGLWSELLCQQNKRTGRRGEGLEGEEIGGWNRGEKGGGLGEERGKARLGGCTSGIPALVVGGVGRFCLSPGTGPLEPGS